MFVHNGYYELKNVDGSSYLNHVDHDKLKKVLDMWFEDKIHNEFGSDVIWCNYLCNYLRVKFDKLLGGWISYFNYGLVIILINMESHVEVFCHINVHVESHMIIHV